MKIIIHLSTKSLILVDVKSTTSNKHRDIAKAGNIMKSRTGEGGGAIFTGNKIGSPGVEGVGGRKRL